MSYQPDIRLIAIYGSAVTLCLLLIFSVATVVRWLGPYDVTTDPTDPPIITGTDDAPASLILSGDLRGLQAAVAAGADLNHRLANDWTLLHLAAANSQSAIADWLVAEGLTLTTPDTLGQRPFELALQNAHPELARRLTPADDRTAIAESVAAAIRNDAASLVKSLLAGDEPIEQFITAGQQTPLHHAARYDRSELLAWLLKKSRTVDALDAHGRTPLHIAALHDAPAAAELLLRAGADVNHLDARQYAPLHYAALAGHAEMVQCLLRHHATLDLASPDGTPLTLATTRGQLDLIDLLLPPETD